jgi:fructose transport system permease protein
MGGRCWLSALLGDCAEKGGKMAEAQEFEKVLDKSDRSVAAFDHQGVSFVKRAQHFLHSTPAAVPLIVLLVSIIVFGLTIGGRFFSSYTLTLILQQIAIVGILGAAQTLVILTAGIDLSIGVIMVISAVVMGNCAVVYGLPAILAVAVGLGVGTLCGLLNGFLVAVMKLPPFIVTLGTWNIVMATNFIYSANDTRRRRHGVAGAYSLVRAQPHRLGQTCLRGGG